MSAEKKLSVMLTVILNPFDPTKLERSNPEWFEGSTAGSFVPPLMNSFIVAVNGKVLEDEEVTTYAIKAEDSLVVVPVPQGGGGKSKNIFRIVALIAIAVIAPYAAAALPGASATIGIGTLTVGSLYTVGISMVGSMLVNALLPPSSAIPSKNNFNQGLEESPTYGIDGAKNTANEDVAVPIVYGRHRVAGNRIGAYVNNVGTTQDLYLLYNAGEGPIAGVSDIELNGQPAANYLGFSSLQRVGSATQEPIGWFQNSLTPITRSVNLSISFSTYITSKEVDKLRVDLVAPSGMAYYNDQGGTDAISVPVEIQYRRVGTVGWASMPDVNNRNGVQSGYYYTDTEIETTTLRSGTSVSGSAIIENATGQRVGVLKTIAINSTVHKMNGRGRQVIRRSFESPQLPEAEYEVRVRRTTVPSNDVKTVDTLVWSDVVEIVTDKVAYRHTALLAVLVQLSDQLSSIPNVTYMHQGKLVKVRRMVGANEVWTFEPSSNPAWVSYDVITNKRYGGRIAESRIDLIQWQEWADYCDQKGLEFNGVFDTQSNVWDTLQMVFRVGHAQIVNQGTRYTVAIERADAPVMMFNSSNIVEKSFKLNWLPKAERANEIEVTFWNKDAGYNRQMIKVRDPSVGPNEPVRTARVTLFGVTDSQQATREAIFQLNLNKHILRTVEFDASIDAIACTVGSQILVQHDITNWGEGGRAEKASTSSIIKLDREVDVFAGRTYSVLVSYDSIQRGAGTVAAVVSNVVWLNNFDGFPGIKRIIINGVDYEIRRIVNNGAGQLGVELEDVSAIITGHVYATYDTDVIVQRTVTNAPGTHTQLTVDSPFPAPPAFRTKWMFGTIESVKRPFRVMSISGGGDYERNIKAIEYKAEVYDLTTDNVIPVTESPVSIGQVRGLTSDNTWVKSGDTYSPVADLGWELPLQGYYGGVEVYMAKNGGGFVKVATVGAQELEYSHVGLSVGDVAIFKVRAVDIIGSKSNLSSAPTVDFTALARPETGTPTNLAVTTSGGSYVLSWNNPTEAFKSIQVWRSTTDDYLTATKINEVSGESYTDSNAPMGVQVYYWVRTVNADGLLGEWNAANGETAPIPGQVSDLALVSPFTGTSVSIKWTGIPEARDYIVEVMANSILSRAVSVSGSEYTYSLSDAVNDNNMGRAITFTVKPRLQSGVMGAGVSLVATNPQVATAPSNVVIGTTGDHVTVNFDKKEEGDLQGYKIWASQTLGFTPSPLNLIQDGRNNGGIFPVNPGETWHVIVGAYDVWGADGMALSGSSSIEATTSAAIASQLTDTIDRSHLAGVLRGELDALDNQWTIKVEHTTADGTPYIAGMGLAVVDGEDGATTSQMLIAADTFAIMPSTTSPGASATYPFIVSDGKVYIRQVFIEDGSITNAKIANVIQSNSFSPTSGWRIDKSGTAEFSNIIIRDSAGNVILSSGEGVVGSGTPNPDDFGAMAFLDEINSANISTYIAAAAIGTVQIGNGTITNAKIANDIQSNNFAAGTTGWRIQKSGSAEFNTATFRGQIDVKSAATGSRLEIKNDVIKIFDGNVLRVKIGNLLAP